jgi:hypothetical protein
MSGKCPYTFLAVKVTNPIKSTISSHEFESCTMGVSQKGILRATKMFRDQIYSNKIWAAVRETLANAVDEHRKHSVSRPIEITLPSQTSPSIEIRDFAQGLSKQNVFRVFFQYFESSKDQSNDAIGGFGIGAKAPLAYTDSFFVTSFFEGVKSQYCANIDGATSTASEITASRSDEPSGISVKIPVAANDFESFDNCVRFFVAMAEFDNFKIIRNGVEISRSDLKVPEFLVSPAGDFSSSIGEIGAWNPWHRSLCRSFLGDGGVFVRDGDLIYPVPSASVKDVIGTLRAPITIVNVRRGEIDIAPSRESVDPTRKTLSTLKRKVNALIGEASTHFQKRIDKGETARQKRAAYHEIKSLGFKSDAKIPNVWKVSRTSSRILSISDVEVKNITDRSGNSWYNIIEIAPENGVTLVVSGNGSTLPVSRTAMNFLASVKPSIFSGILKKETSRTTVRRIDAREMDLSSSIPEGWKEGEDYIVFDKSKITKEGKAIIESIRPSVKRISAKGNRIASKADIPDDTEVARRTSSMGHSRSYNSIDASEIRENIARGFDVVFAMQSDMGALRSASVLSRITKAAGLSPVVIVYAYKKNVRPLTLLGAYSFEDWANKNRVKITATVEKYLSHSLAAWFADGETTEDSSYKTPESASEMADVAFSPWLNCLSPASEMEMDGSTPLPSGKSGAKYAPIDRGFALSALPVIGMKEYERLQRKYRTDSHPWAKVHKRFVKLDPVTREMLMLTTADKNMVSFFHYRSNGVPAIKAKVSQVIADLF